MTGSIWVVLQHRDGKLHRGSWEAIAAGQALAGATGGSVEAVILGAATAALATEAAACDLAAVRVLESELLAAYTPGGYVASLAAAMAVETPDLVLFPHTYQSCEFVPRLAQVVGAAYVPEATSYDLAEGAPEWTRPILGGKLQARVRARGEGPVLVSLQAGAFAADSRRAGSCEIRPLEVDLGTVVVDREILGVEEAASDAVDLSKAGVIVAVGRGVGAGDKMGPIEELAGLLGADIGASRPVIDSGWLPRDRQIGSSGQTVAPKLYVALGISGAIQHLVGMKGSGCVVAVNKDPGAPIFKVSDYGIVGDLHEVVPAIIEAIRAGD